MCLTPDNKALDPNRSYTESELRDMGCPIEDWLNSNHLIKIAGDHRELEASVIPGVTAMPPLSPNDAKDKTMEIRTGTADTLQTSRSFPSQGRNDVPSSIKKAEPDSLAKDAGDPVNPQTGSQPHSRWAFDPASLSGLSLVKLNLLISENAKTEEEKAMGEFRSKSEAIAWLSQDFGKIKA